MDPILLILDRIGSDNPPTDSELSEARTELRKLLDVATSEEGRDLEAAKEIGNALSDIAAEETARAEAKAAEEEEARKLRETYLKDEADDSDATDDETSEADAEAETVVEVVVEDEKAPVAAAGRSRNLGSAVTRTRARVTEDKPTENPYARLVTLGAAAKDKIDPSGDLRDVAQVFSQAAPRVMGFGSRDVLVRLEAQMPETRQLFGAKREENDALIERLLAPQAVAAAGGICDPLPADFVHPIFGDRGRPLRDALPRFQASRGGVRYSPAADLSAVSGGVGVWTHETDTSPGENEKACLVVECEDELSEVVDAITACLTIGNFQARFNPELWRSRLELLGIAHDRLAETTNYSDILANVTAWTTHGAGNGTIYAVLAGVAKAAEGIRSRSRILRGTIRVVLPSWLRAALREDIASQRPFDLDAFAVADNRIDQFFTSRGLRPIWSPDVDLFAAQTAGTSQSPVALNTWPGGNVRAVLFPEGAFFHLDGGTLDLGTEIIDSELIKQNNRQAFWETFEKVAYRGGEVIAVDTPVDEVCICPDVAVLEPTSPVD